MYNDLDPKLWPGDVGIVGNPNILKLFAGSEGDGQESSHFAEEYEVDEPTVSRKVPLLITEADSSQFSAIVDVMDKKNIALRGRPGTGKSQTITNIIAAALDKGLRVLFVADKMAALDVVKERLTSAGLGDFCFELHSTRSRKKELPDPLRQGSRSKTIPTSKAARVFVGRIGETSCPTYGLCHRHKQGIWNYG